MHTIFFNNAFNSFEENASAGGIFSQKLKDLGTPNQAPRIKKDGKLDYSKKGQWTGSTAKKSYYDLLEEAIRLWQIRIFYKPAIKELMAYYRPEGADPQAPKGGHDDFISAGGGCERINRYNRGGFEIYTGKYR